MIQRINHFYNNSKFFGITSLLIIIHFSFFIFEPYVELNNSASQKIIKDYSGQQVYHSIVNCSAIHVRKYSKVKRIKKNSHELASNNPIIIAFTEQTNYTAPALQESKLVINTYIEFRPPPLSFSVQSF